LKAGVPAAYCVLRNKKITEYNNMKVTRYKADFSPLLDAVNKDTIASNGLQAEVHAFWGKTRYTNTMEFRKDFVEWYVSIKVYSDPKESAAYANRVAAKAGFRLRAVGAGPKKAPTKTPFEAWIAKMPKKLTAKERKLLLAMI